MTREQKINAGKIWQVFSAENQEQILFEGTKSKCLAHIRVNFKADYKRGIIKLAKLIYEAQ